MIKTRVDVIAYVGYLSTPMFTILLRNVLIMQADMLEAVK